MNLTPETIGLFVRFVRLVPSQPADSPIFVEAFHAYADMKPGAPGDVRSDTISALFDLTDAAGSDG